MSYSMRSSTFEWKLGVNPVNGLGVNVIFVFSRFAPWRPSWISDHGHFRKELSPSHHQSTIQIWSWSDKAFSFKLRETKMVTQHELWPLWPWKMSQFKKNVIYVVQHDEPYILVKVWWKSGQRFKSECHFCVFMFCPVAAILDIGPRPFSKGTFPFPPSIHHTNMKLIGQGILFKSDGNQRYGRTPLPRQYPSTTFCRLRGKKWWMSVIHEILANLSKG